MLIALLMSLAGCDKLELFKREAGEIPVSLVGTSGSCPQQINIEGERWLLNHFAFYLSQPEIKIEGKWQALKFKPGEDQSETVALITLASDCDNRKRSNSTLMLDANEALMNRATSLRFTLGLPPQLNHADISSLSEPLNNADMFWSTQKGRKFMRLDLQQAGENGKRWRLHVSSAGCSSPSSEAPPACTEPNRVTFILPMTQNDMDLRLEASVADIVWRVSQAKGEGCGTEAEPQAVCSRLMRNVIDRPWLTWD